MSLDHILLGELRKPATGYELGSRFDDAAGHFWPAERSQIYPALKRLQERGLLACVEGPSERGPRRKIYSTTDAGLVELRRWLTEGAQIGRERLAYIAQIYHLGALEDLEAALGMVEQMRARWRTTLDLFESFENQVRDEVGDFAFLEGDDFFNVAALRMGVHQMRAKLAWCDETTQLLEAKLGAASAAAPVEES